MKKPEIIIYLFTICVFIFGCKDDDMPPVEIAGDPNTSFLFDFDNLEIGQTFQFTLLSGERYFDNEAKDLFSYTNDTLEIELVDITEDVFTFEERILPTSAMFNSADNYYWMGKDSVYTHEWKIENDTLKITAVDELWIQSHLFFGGNFWEGGVFIPLYPFTGEEAAIDGWKTTKDYCECDMDLYTENFTLFGIQYDRLNIAIRNTPMQGDGNGSTYLYNITDGIVRSINYSWWTGKGLGWDRIK